MGANTCVIGHHQGVLVQAGVGHRALGVRGHALAGRQGLQRPQLPLWLYCMEAEGQGQRCQNGSQHSKGSALHVSQRTCAGSHGRVEEKTTVQSVQDFVAGAVSSSCKLVKIELRKLDMY